MVRQNVALQNADGSHRCWLAPKEIDRMLKNRSVRRVLEKGKPVKYRMVTAPAPSDSRESPCEIQAFEMQQLPQFGERRLKCIARATKSTITDKDEARRLADDVTLVQRWMGHGLIPTNSVTEVIAQY